MTQHMTVMSNFAGCDEVVISRSVYICATWDDDVIKEKHFPRYRFFVGESTGHRWLHLTKASVAEIWCILWSAFEKNGWANNRYAGDLRRRRAYYGVTVMKCPISMVRDYRIHGWIPGTCLWTNIPLQWHHMTIMASRITDHSSVCSTICQGCQRNIKAPRDWPFIRIIHRWPMDSPHKWPGR